jgi:hypothetical protein
MTPTPPEAKGAVAEDRQLARGTASSGDCARQRSRRAGVMHICITHERARRTCPAARRLRVVHVVASEDDRRQAGLLSASSTAGSADGARMSVLTKFVVVECGTRHVPETATASVRPGALDLRRRPASTLGNQIADGEDSDSRRASGLSPSR